MVPGVVPLCAAGRKCTLRPAVSPGGGKSQKQTAAGRWYCGVSGGLQSDGGHLVLLFANAQGEKVQGSVKESVGAVVEQLERRDMAVPPGEDYQHSG
jgi:hypothetical protein